MSKDAPTTFTSPNSAGLTVTMGDKGAVSFRDGVAQVSDPDQLEELRDWIKANPGYGVYEGEPKKEEPAKSGAPKVEASR